jgi:outer membrane PBP1 activator LpoA protein
MLRRRWHILVAVTMAALLYGGAPLIASESPPPRGIPVALILPLQSPVFGTLADSVRRGVMAAAKADHAALLAIAVYPTAGDADSTLAAYEQATTQGNRLIIGPLTRDAVTIVARRMPASTPVLALNLPEGDAPLPDNLYAFSLQVEAEARQVARMAFQDGRRSALTVTESSPLARRINTAFADEFTRQGGRVVAQFAYSSVTADLLALREAATNGEVDTVFLALEAQRARLVRPYVDGSAQIYATSQVFNGPIEPLRDAELNGVRFVDMPWLLEPDHPAVMIYAHQDASTLVAGDSERLYALGIDAYRIASDLLYATRIAREPLDGVTGRISLTPERQLVRELTAAQFTSGRPVPIAPRQ